MSAEETTAREQALAFECEGAMLFGILHPGEPSATRGLLVVVGGPQTRVGSHRQFVLLARALAADGVPTLRFDYRGMGDSEGELRGFETVSRDIESAVDAFFAEVPGLREVVLWGLCDAASASLFYAHADPRVTGLVLLNPWVHSEQGEARAFLHHWYLQRLRDPAFWRRVAGGQFRLGASLRSLWAHLREARTGEEDPQSADQAAASCGSLTDRVAEGLELFRGRVLLILSGRDLTAREFCDELECTPRWQRAATGRALERHEIAEANHTFATAGWRAQVERWTLDWFRSW